MFIVNLKEINEKPLNLFLLKKAVIQNTYT